MRSGPRRPRPISASDVAGAAVGGFEGLPASARRSALASPRIGQRRAGRAVGGRPGEDFRASRRPGPEQSFGTRRFRPLRVPWEEAMALWAGLVAFTVAVVVVLTRQLDLAVVLRSIVELGAVVSVFALICAAEASN